MMRGRQHGGPPGMACALKIPGVQGSSAVTLNQNRHLPFEQPEGRRTAGQINAKVGSAGALCVYVCVCMFMCKPFSSLLPLRPLLVSDLYRFTNHNQCKATLELLNVGDVFKVPTGVS